MLKNLVSMLALGVFISLTACNKEDLGLTQNNLTDVSVSSLSEKITTYIDDNHPEANIMSAQTSTETNEIYVSLDTREDLTFDGNGAFARRGHGNGFSGGCPGGGPNGGGHPGGHGNGHGNGNGHGHGHHGDSTHVHTDTIPQFIADYVAANYAGYTAHHAHTDSLCTGEVATSVRLVSADTTLLPIVLFFDAQNNFLMSGSRIAYTATPAAVQATVTANYADYTAANKAIEFTLASGEKRYGIGLRKPAARKRVLIGADGTVICE